MNFLGLLEMLLARLCERDAAAAGVIWVVHEGRYPIRVAAHNWNETGLADSVDLREAHAGLIASLFPSCSDDVVVLDPKEPFSQTGERDYVNPTPLTIAAAPFTRSRTRIGIVELFFSPDGGANELSVKQLAYTAQFCFESDATFDLKSFPDLKSFKPMPPPNEGEAMSMARTLLSVHKGPSLEHTPIIVANEGRRIIGCMRTSVLLRRRGKLRIEAISGQESVERRAHEVQLIESLVEAVAPIGDLFWWPHSKAKLPPEIKEKLDLCLDETTWRSIGIVPLAKSPSPGRFRSGTVAKVQSLFDQVLNRRPQPIGAIVCEWSELGIDERARDWLRIFAQHASIALTNASNQTLGGVCLKLLRVPG